MFICFDGEAVTSNLGWSHVGKSGAEVRIQGTDAKTGDGGELARGARGEGTEGDD